MRFRLCLACIGFGTLAWVRAGAQPQDASVSVAKEATTGREWVTVMPPEYSGAINNPLKGFRDYKAKGYGLLERVYIKWSDIEVCAEDGVERILAHTHRITQLDGRRFEDLNVKLVPRVFLDWNGTPGRQHWPADLQTFDYDSAAFQERLVRLVAKLGQAWDKDPRIFAVQMGLIGYWGEHHSPAPTAEQRRLLTEAFQHAFRNKPVLVRHTDAEFMQAGFGIYYDTFANLSREPHNGVQNQFPWQALNVYPELWKRAPIEGEVEYNWQRTRASTAKPLETYGFTPDETMQSPAYRRYLIDKIRRYHTSYLGWISSYDDSNREVVAGAGELQKAFGYRFVLETVRYPVVVQPGAPLPVQVTVRNTGSAPFYLAWPVAVALLEPSSKRPVWVAPLEGVDLRRWLPGEDWDSGAFAYRRPPLVYQEEGQALVPSTLKPGSYLLALAILDREGGLKPSARFAIKNYLKGGWHPLGFVGVGEAPKQVALENLVFADVAFDDSLHYTVPEHLRVEKAPPLPTVAAVKQWRPEPELELINPWRYWTLEGQAHGIEKEVQATEPGTGSTWHRYLRVRGAFTQGTSLRYSLGKNVKLDKGRYRLAFRMRGTPGASVDLELADSVDFQLADGPRIAVKEREIPLAEVWQEKTLEFEIGAPFTEQAFLRFRLKPWAEGLFELTEVKLKRLP